MQTKKQNKLHSVCNMLLVVLFVFASIPSIRVNAAGYNGSGTMTDPYLVETAGQLQDMRDNLSAHYKLANTIDLSGMDFKPIGRLDAPFTGSFVCEMNADMTPKYAIKNLKVAVAETPYAAENKNKWEAALFGATNGATISGIYVLDANISNQVLGDNKGSVQYGDYKPGMDEMNSAILIGYANSTTVVNCGVTGTIKTRASHCAGLIGRVENSSIENCYSTTAVTSEGKWNIGGLLGTAVNTMVTACFSTGNVIGSQSNIGAFIGSSNGATITDCYATGNASGGKERKNSFVVQQDGASVVMTNCFALGRIDAAVNKVDNPLTATNCWVLSGQLHNTNKFTEGSLAQIKSAFANLPNWDVSGNQPQLKTIGVVTDASKYTPQEASQQPDNDGTITENGAVSGSSGSAASQSTITPEEVLTLIEKLPNPEIDGNITAKNKDAIKEAWKAYEGLSTGDKDSFDTSAFAKLADCRYQVSLLIVSDWLDAVEALPDKKDLTMDDIDTINELWDDYLFIDPSILESSSRFEKLKAKLEAAHEYAEENANVLQGAAVELDTGLTKGELVLVVACLTLFVAILTFELFATLTIIKRNRNSKKEVIKDEETV